MDKLAEALADLLEPALTEKMTEIERKILDKQSTTVTVYTVDEAAKILRTSRDQISAYIRTGKLVSFKLERDSRKNLIYASDLLDLIARLKEESA